MSIIYDGTTLPSGADITFDGTLLEKVIFDGVTVWSKAVRAFTFNATSNKCENITNANNDAYIKFGSCGYVGSDMSIGNDSGGRSIRLLPKRSGTLRFYLKAYNQTGSSLTCNCTIFVDSKKYQTTISANSSKTITKDISVKSGQVINIGNDGQNAWMYIDSGSYIDWIN